MSADEWDKTDDSNFFWQSKYKQLDGPAGNTYIDGSDTLGNKGQFVISFHHIPSGKQVFFKAFVTKYSENYTSEWSGENVFGRTDPIYTFGNTTRKIELGFSVPAGSESEAYENMGRISRLAQFMYPAYFETNPGTLDSSLTIGQSPLVRIKMMNLVQKTRISDTATLANLVNAKAGKKHESWKKRQDIYNNYQSTWLPTEGILAAIQNLSLNTELGKDGVLEKGPNTVMPKNFEVTLSFAVIHEQTLGWNESGESLDPAFPYGVVLAEPGDLKVDDSHQVGRSGGGDSALGSKFWKGGYENGRIGTERQLQALDDSADARYGNLWAQMTGKAKREADNKKAVFIWGKSDKDRAGGDSLYNQATQDQAQEYLDNKKKKD